MPKFARKNKLLYVILFCVGAYLLYTWWKSKSLGQGSILSKISSVLPSDYFNPSNYQSTFPTNQTANQASMAAYIANQSKNLPVRDLKYYAGLAKEFGKTIVVGNRRTV